MNVQHSWGEPAEPTEQRRAFGRYKPWLIWPRIRRLAQSLAAGCCPFLILAACASFGEDLGVIWETSGASGARTQTSVVQQTIPGGTLKIFRQESILHPSRDKMFDNYQNILPFSKMMVEMSAENTVTKVRCILELERHDLFAEFISTDQGRNFVRRGVLAYLVAFRLLGWEQAPENHGLFLASVPDCQISIEMSERYGIEREKLVFPMQSAQSSLFLKAENRAESGDLFLVKIPWTDFHTKLKPICFFLWLLGKPDTQTATTVMHVRDDVIFGREFPMVHNGYVRISLPATDVSRLRLIEESTMPREDLNENSALGFGNTHRERDWLWHIFAETSTDVPAGTMIWKRGSKDDPLNNWLESTYFFTTLKIG